MCRSFLSPMQGCRLYCSPERRRSSEEGWARGIWGWTQEMEGTPLGNVSWIYAHIFSILTSKWLFSLPKQWDRYQHAYNTFINLAPTLKELINNPKKRDELWHVLGRVSAHIYALFHLTQYPQMKRVITSVRSDDCARLKEQIGHYILLNPAKDIISPPIHDGQSSRSHLGFNHCHIHRFY